MIEQTFSKVQKLKSSTIWKGKSFWRCSNNFASFLHVVLWRIYCKAKNKKTLKFFDLMLNDLHIIFDRFHFTCGITVRVVALVLCGFSLRKMLYSIFYEYLSDYSVWFPQKFGFETEHTNHKTWLFFPKYQKGEGRKELKTDHIQHLLLFKIKKGKRKQRTSLWNFLHHKQHCIISQNVS